MSPILRSVLDPRKKLFWSFIEPGNSDVEGYGDVRLLHCSSVQVVGPFAGTGLAESHAPKIEPKPMSTFPQNETLAVACWDTLVHGTAKCIPDPRLLIREVPLQEKCVYYHDS